MLENPSDRVIVKCIYDTYRAKIEKSKNQGPSLPSALYIQIDRNSIAKKLNMHPDVLYGRLLYHLNKKHSYEEVNGAKIHLFSHEVESGALAVNFPLLGAVLADVEQSFYRYMLPVVLSMVALTLSVLSFFN